MPSRSLGTTSFPVTMEKKNEPNVARNPPFWPWRLHQGRQILPSECFRRRQGIRGRNFCWVSQMHLFWARWRAGETVAGFVPTMSARHLRTLSPHYRHQWRVLSLLCQPDISGHLAHIIGISGGFCPYYVSPTSQDIKPTLSSSVAGFVPTMSARHLRTFSPHYWYQWRVLSLLCQPDLSGH